MHCTRMNTVVWYVYSLLMSVCLFISRNRAKKEHEKQWSELQQYIRPEHHVLPSVLMDDQAEARRTCPVKVCIL